MDGDFANGDESLEPVLRVVPSLVDNETVIASDMAGMSDNVDDDDADADADDDDEEEEEDDDDGVDNVASVVECGITNTRVTSPGSVAEGGAVSPSLVGECPWRSLVFT